MPYGNVESDIYSNWNHFDFYNIENKNLTILKNITEDDFILISDNLKTEISEAVDSLTKINSELINYNSLQLVELSHKWFSWESMFSYAKSNYRYSEFIPSNLIKEENKTFELAN